MKQQDLLSTCTHTPITLGASKEQRALGSAEAHAETRTRVEVVYLEGAKTQEGTCRGGGGRGSTKGYSTTPATTEGLQAKTALKDSGTRISESPSQGARDPGC